MDILAIQPSTITVDIKHPATGAPIGLQVECVSLEDDRVKVVERQIKNRSLKGGRNTVTAEKIEDNTIEILAAAGNGRPISPLATSKTRSSTRPTRPSCSRSGGSPSRSIPRSEMRRLFLRPRRRLSPGRRLGSKESRAGADRQSRLRLPHRLVLGSGLGAIDRLRRA
jgi:hypothetical protein